jgi:hypothetical protein
MTRDQKIADIRAAAIKANPEIDKELSVCPECLGNGHPTGAHMDTPCNCPGSVGILEGRPIRLADVLLAIGHIIKARGSQFGFITVDSYGCIWKGTPHEIACEWNLRKNDLTEQSDECISFLAELLK